MDLPNRTDYERQLPAALTGQGQQHAAELASALKRDPLADPGQAYWERVESDRNATPAAILILLFMSSATAHGASQDQASQLAAGMVPERAAAVAEVSTRTLRDRLAAKQTEWRSQAATLEPSIPILTPAEIDELCDQLVNSQVNSMAITEVSNGITDASEIVINDLGLKSAFDTWQTERDAKVCPICSPLGGANRDTWNQQFPSGPPAHPNCRCYIRYVNLDE
ncbi:hypothetical protein [Blastopirellula retiformator]|uniref:Phage Mu protein F like protein n=1 Tax=Blastopirellula retiformator TaxID=2527970 RepID=A0A5C5UWZ3_9BACT|nr:hypothetical protein [Blastopirellula retiformator]TWT30708.1 hypothetical protein Enr8_42310 [Blastopirellula retiformator]